MGATLFAPAAVKAMNAMNDTPEMLAFWNAYPRKVGKDAARAELRKALKRTTIDVILDALARTRWPNDPQFIPHPKRWLSEGRWADEQPDGVSDPVARILGL